MRNFGNRHKYFYDGIIINYIMKESMSIHKKDWRSYLRSFHPMGSVVYNIQPQTFTSIYHAIRDPDIFRPNGNPEISKTTVRRHLDKMVAQHVLVRHSKAGRDPNTGRRYNKRPYGLHRKTWLRYLVYLLELLIRFGPGSRSKHLFFERWGASLAVSLKPLDIV